VVLVSAFADEISDDLTEQIAVLARNQVSFADMRGVGGRNVLDLSQREARAVRAELDRHGIAVASLASPVGKCPVDVPPGELRRRFERAAALAHIFGTPWLRVFSFFRPAADPVPADPGGTAWRDAVLARLATMTGWARESGVLLLVENEQQTYADTIARAAEVLAHVGGDHCGLVFDAANFVHCGQQPYPDAYHALRPWLRQVHVKDVSVDGRMVAAGQGVARWPELLRELQQDGYTGYLSLEPHLARAGRLGGFTGPDLFDTAAVALRDLLRVQGWNEANR